MAKKKAPNNAMEVLDVQTCLAGPPELLIITKDTFFRMIRNPHVDVKLHT
jgi:hypothetical protein